MSSFFRLLVKKRNRGFTLVEMIVSVAILAILMAGMMLFISPVVRSFNDTNRNMLAENVSTCVQKYITSSIRNADKVIVFGNTNDEQLKISGNDKISALKKFCADNKTSGGANAYVLKCISLRFDDTDGRYYLYHETINTSGVGDTTDPLNAATRFNVFSKVLYRDLYIDFTFQKPLDMDKAGESPQPVRKDALQMSVNTYADKEHNNLLFVGSGLTELRQIKKDIAKNKAGSTCELAIYEGASATAKDTLKTADGITGSKNVYIYYLIRSLSN